MKTPLGFLAILTMMASLFIQTGCSSVSIRTNQALGVQSYPPNPSPASIQVLTVPPTKPHVRLGEIQAEPYSQNVSAAKITESLQKAAAKLGADAVVIVSDKNQVMGAMVTGGWYNRSVQAIDQRVILAVAIKYQ